MWTKRYKNGYIHGYCDKAICHVQYDAGNAMFDGIIDDITNLGYFKSYRAAQLAITRFEKKLAC